MTMKNEDEPLRRYLVFSGMQYYPSGGFNDFVDSWNKLELAIAHAQSLVTADYIWYQIVDTTTGKIVESFRIAC